MFICAVWLLSIWTIYIVGHKLKSCCLVISVVEFNSHLSPALNKRISEFGGEIPAYSGPEELCATVAEVEEIENKLRIPERK